MREKRLLEILKNVFGHKSFRLDQKKVIHAVLDGQDALAIMPTGGGKSLCYQIPALYQEGLTVVVSPLISLMTDQVKALREYGVEAYFLNSSQSFEERKQIEKKIHKGEVKILYASPEGLISGSILQILQDISPSLMAIDEAHCVSEWGHEFRNDYMRLGELKKVFPHTPFLALTATADKKTRDDIVLRLNLQNPQVFISSFDRANIKYSIYDRSHELNQLDHFIKTYHQGHTGIVYCLSRKKVERVTRELIEKGYHAAPYHAGLPAKQREKTQQAFSTDDGIIIVATIAFGMGINRPDVRFVAHLDLPKSIEGYYQETGRAGRDGEKASAFMVYGLQDVIKLSQMLETTEASELYKRQARLKLESMLGLCETSVCRRQYLLQYFEEEGQDYCGNCDTCLEPVETWDGTIDAQKVLSTIFKTGQIFGAAYIIDILRGSQNARVVGRGHDSLSVYGIGKEQSKNHWNTIIRQLLNLGYIVIKNWEFRSLALAEKSRDLLLGKENLKLRKIKQAKKSKEQNKTQKISLASHGRDDLFELLRQKRMSLAKKYHIPPYVVFSDKSLHDMCQLLPRNPSEFLMVNGVGASKGEKYGEAFLEEINTYIQEKKIS